MRWAGVFLAVVLVASCGIPLDSEPEMVDIGSDDVPDPTGPILGDLTAVSIYLVRGDALVHVTRDLPSPVSPESVLDSLLDDVTEPEERAGLRTAIPLGTDAIAITRDGPVLTVDLSREFAAVGGEEEILAVAQIVLTATSMDGIEMVAFALDGVPTDVPQAGGALSDDPVTASDYESLVATAS